MSEQLFEQIASTTVNSVNKCRVQANATNELVLSGNSKITGAGTRVTQNIALILQADCKQDVKSVHDIKTSVKQKLQQVAQQKTDALGDFLGGFTPKGKNETVINSLKMNQRIEDLLTVDTVNDMLTQVTAQNRLVLSGNAEISGGAVVDQSASIQIMVKALQRVSAGQKLAVDIDAMASQINKSEQTGLFSPTVIIAIAVVGLAFLLGPTIINKLSSSSGGGGRRRGGGGGTRVIVQQGAPTASIPPAIPPAPVLTE